MAQYLLSVWHDNTYELDVNTPAAQHRVANVGEFNDALKSAGALVFAGGLAPAASALVVHAVDAEMKLTEGPYATSPQQMGGFWIVEATAETAVSWAYRAASACQAPVEVRPFQAD